MPEETADLMQFRVEYHGFQLLPFSRNTYIYGISEPTVFDESILIDTPPYVLDILSFNLDDSYSHEYNLYVNIIPKKAVNVVSTDGANWWDQFKGIFGGE